MIAPKYAKLSISMLAFHIPNVFLFAIYDYLALKNWIFVSFYANTAISLGLKRKDPGVPNSLPFKESILQEAQRLRALVSVTLMNSIIFFFRNR